MARSPLTQAPHQVNQRNLCIATADHFFLVTQLTPAWDSHHIFAAGNHHTFSSPSPTLTHHIIIRTCYLSCCSFTQPFICIHSERQLRSWGRLERLKMGVEVSNDYEQSPRLHALSITSISELISSQATFHRVTLSPVDLLCKAASSNIIIIDSQQDCSSSACLQEKPFYYGSRGSSSHSATAREGTTSVASIESG